MKKTILIAFIGSVFAISACKKEETTTPPVAQKTKTEIITSGSWKITGITVSDSSGSLDVFALMDDCEKDGFMTFKTDGKFITDEGATKCDPDDPQTSEGTWAFSTDEKTITIDGDPANIISFSDAQIVVEMVDTSGGSTEKTRVTLKKM